MSWLQRYWGWTTGGSRWRLALGIGGPVIALLIVVGAFAGEDPEDTDEAAASVDATATVQGGMDGRSTPSAPPSNTPTQTPELLTYTVQSGDSLSAICQATAPAAPDCVEQTVALNGLSDAAQIAVGQVLTLPPGDKQQQQTTEAAAEETSVLSSTSSPLSATATDEVQAAATPTTIPATASPAPTLATFGSGLQVVGVDIESGTYRAPDGGGSCYWERLSGFSGSLDDVLANDLPSGPTVVNIAATDVAFDSARCGTWTRDLSPITSSPESPFQGDGIYIVGVDVAPGTWRTDSASDCYWARLAGFSGDLDHVLANDLPAGSTAVVTIAPTDVGFESSRCGEWVKIQ